MTVDNKNAHTPTPRGSWAIVDEDGHPLRMEKVVLDGVTYYRMDIFSEQRSEGHAKNGKQESEVDTE